MMNNPAFDQSRIAEAHFMVVGCGALGNEVLKDLVLFGARHLVIVDFDCVEESNLSRSVLFSLEDARQKRRKVDAAAARLRTMNPQAEVIPIFGDIAYEVGLGLIRRMDVVIGCVDSRWARYGINRLCMRAGVPWVDGGIDQLEGTARVFRPGQNCYACNLGPEGLRALKYRRPCSGLIREQEEKGHAPTTPITASIVAAVQVQEALKLIHRQELAEGKFTSLCGRMFYYEGQHLTTRYIQFKAYDEDCPVHAPWTPIERFYFTTQHPVSEVLTALEEHFGHHPVDIEMVDDCFVDFVAHRFTDEKKEVMKPGRQVAEFLQTQTEEGIASYYEHEYHCINRQFPYPHLTLGELGFPAESVWPVNCQGKTYYIEMENQ
jgi:adenylyltransferase/sulfurtransferase